MAINKRLILGSILGCAAAYSAYSYYDRSSAYDDMEKNAKLKGIPGGLTKGIIVPVKKGHFVTGDDKKKHFVPDAIQPADPNAPSTAPVEPLPTAAPAVATSASPNPAAAAPTPAKLANAAVPPSPPVTNPIPQPVPSPAANLAAQPNNPITLLATPTELPKLPQPVAIPSTASATHSSAPAAPAQSKLESAVSKPEVVAKPPPQQKLEAENAEKSCDWKPGANFANIRFGSNLFRFNLRSDLSATSSLIHPFEGHAKTTVVTDDSKGECGSTDCLIINAELIASLTKDGFREFRCGDWYLVTDGSEDACSSQIKTRSLVVSKSAAGHCVVGSLVDVRTSQVVSSKQKNLTSSIYVTGTKPESAKPAPAARKADDE